MPMPAGLVARLRKNPRTKAVWDSLTPSRRKEIKRYLNSAKRPAVALAMYVGLVRLIAPLEEDIGRAVFEYDEYINMLVKERANCSL